MKNIFKFTLLLIALSQLAACVSGSASRIAVLQNPQTKQTVECRVNPWGSVNRNEQITTCIDTYIKAGYVKLSDSAD